MTFNPDFFQNAGTAQGAGHQVTMYLTSTYWQLSRKDDDEHTYSTLEMSFQLTKELSIEATYSVGADAHKFGFTRSSLMGLDVKF